jgi:hypothetical protein
MHLMPVMRFHMFLQLVTAMEILATIRVFTCVLAHLAVSPAMFGEVGGLGKALAADVTFQGLVFCMGSFVDSWNVC